MKIPNPFKKPSKSEIQEEIKGGGLWGEIFTTDKKKIKKNIENGKQKWKDIFSNDPKKKKEMQEQGFFKWFNGSSGGKVEHKYDNKAPSNTQANSQGGTGGKIYGAES